MDYLKCFVCGGLICVVGQILVDRTKLSSGRILVLFVMIGCALGAVGLYKPFAEFAGAGATVPLPGFGYLLSKGVVDAIEDQGFLGVFTGGLRASSGGIAAAVVFAFLASMAFSPKGKG
ncbi:MAG: SpoVA/SpoVAEb family sporulation membrane protein [Clostridiales bacterium]|nr:SpoVA/SpoVAEb family sporulation membrane protein [Clostridiales bacterium]